MMMDGPVDDNYPPLPIVSNLKVVLDSSMGRCLVATGHFSIGDVLYKEDAFLYAPFDEGARLPPRMIKQLLSVFPKAVLKEFDDHLDELCHLDTIQSLDTARCFLQLVAIMELRRQDKIAEYYSANDLWYLDQLTGHNVRGCTEDIRQFRISYPNVLPKGNTDADYGRLLAILNTNQLELEEYGGSGLFLGTPIFQHDCSPNCSYSTDQHSLWMTAIRDIMPGDRVSIDYKNEFYRPTIERIESLSDSYGFICRCSQCCGPDRTRAFVCDTCKKGSVFPIGACESIEQNDSFTVCAACGAMTSIAFRQRCLDREDVVRDEKPQSMKDMEALLTRESGIMRETHFLFFWLWDDLTMNLVAKVNQPSKSSASGKGATPTTAASDCRVALAAMKRTIELLDGMLPQVHHEKVIYYDRQAQLEVVGEMITQAKESYRRAYIMSKMASGECYPGTIRIKQLVDNTPRNKTELQINYMKDHADEGMEVENFNFDGMNLDG